MRGSNYRWSGLTLPSHPIRVGLVSGGWDRYVVLVSLVFYLCIQVTAILFVGEVTYLLRCGVLAY